MSRRNKNNSKSSNGAKNSNYQRIYKNKYNSNKTKCYKPSPESELVRRVQSQPGIGKSLILFCRDGDSPFHIIQISTARIHGTMIIKDVPQKKPIQFQLKINGVVITEGFYQTLLEAKRSLSELALAELQKVCFTIVKKSHPKDLPKFEIAAASQSNLAVGGIGAKMMEKMGWSGKGLGSQEQGRTDIVKPHFNINRQGFGSQNIAEEVRNVLEKYSASQDYNSIAFSPDFTKDERAAIHVIARKLNLRTRSYGQGQERFLIVENKIQPWNLVHALLEAGGENEQYKLITPTNFA